MMNPNDRRLKRQMIEALREENESLAAQLESYKLSESRFVEISITGGSHAISGLIQAVQALVAAMPKTKEGVAALEKARQLCETYGIPLPTALKKIPRPRRRKKPVRKARSSSTRRLATP